MNFLQAFIHETARCEENGDSRLETEGPKVRPFELPIARFWHDSDLPA
jgi:hypothetical protein